MNTEKDPIVLAFSGASALQLGERALQLLLNNDFNVNLVLSKGAYEVAQSERKLRIPVNPSTQERFWRDKLDVKKGQLTCHKWNDISASIASGSFKTIGMVIVPCTMGKLGRIAAGISSDLVERTADVHLKERRPLLISPRESPLSLIHLSNMQKLTESGALIIPPIPAWYTNPNNIEDIIDYIVVRLFDPLGIDLYKINRWRGIKSENI